MLWRHISTLQPTCEFHGSLKNDLHLNTYYIYFCVLVLTVESLVVIPAGTPHITLEMELHAWWLLIIRDKYKNLICLSRYN